MATVQTQRAKTNRLAERDPQVYHPLDRLRGIIRRYVVIEGVLSAILFLAVWFTLALALDYGLFKVSGWDWARDGARWVRGVALVVALGLFAALLLFRIVQRLNTEFSYPALALVLERKFPKVLGDRLITAVEMADVEAMGRFGYSKDMIRATIAEARERVGKVPVDQVFNWKRLWTLGYLTAGILAFTLLVSFDCYALAARPELVSLLVGKVLLYGALPLLVLGYLIWLVVLYQNNQLRVWSALIGLSLSLGVWLVLFAGYALVTKTVSVYRFAWRSAHVTGILAERDLALMNTPWPRQAHLELIGFPASGEMTVGRDAPPPRIAVRAYRWVIADRHTPDGWRPLVWSDLTPEFVGRPVPALPPSVLAVTSGEGESTVDAVERWVSETPGEIPPDLAKFRSALRYEMNAGGAHGYEELQEVFRALVEKADSPSMGRTLRRLDVPRTVTYRYAGTRTAGEGTLTPQQNNEFAGEITGLKEDVSFVVRGEDYESGARRIRLIPPPTLRRLGRDQSEPAYLHHASPQNEGYSVLENKLQKVAVKDLSLTGDRTVFVVPAGTELTITAEAYRGDDDQISETDRLVAAHAIPVAGRFPGTVFDDKGKPTQAPVPLKVSEDGGSFSMTFNENKLPDAAGEPKISLPKPRAVGTDFVSAATASALAALKKHTDFRLTDNVEFKVVFANKYNVTTTRSFLIQVVQDQPPTVEVAVDVIRRSGNFFLVTPKARIPFNPDSFIKDDRGLSEVRYTFEYWPEDSDLVRSIRTKYALRSLLETPLPGTPGTAAIALRQADHFRMLDTADKRLPGSVFISEFRNQDKELARDTLDVFLRRLSVAKSEDAAPPAVKKIELKNADRDYFDLKELHDANILKIAAQGTDVQTIYRMDLNIQAIDTNVDAADGPRVTKNAEPIRLRIVSESDLLIEISREEEQLAAKLDEALLKLAAAKKKYEFVRTQYDVAASRYERVRPNDQPDKEQKDQAAIAVDAVKTKSLDAMQDVDKARDIVAGVVREFRRLTRECEVNRLNDAALAHYRNFTNVVENILREDAQAEVTFPKTQGLMNGVQTGVTTMSDVLTERLKNLGDRTPLPPSIPAAAVTDADLSLHALERELARIRGLLGEAQSKEKVKRLLLAVKEEQVRIRRGIESLEEAERVRLTSPEPLLGPTGVVTLKTGGTAKVTHKIEWRQYKEDDLLVKVNVSDPSLVVPPELKLNFERHELQFDYEVKAGAKKGAFKVTLTPAVGKPVEVQVVVE